MPDAICHALASKLKRGHRQSVHCHLNEGHEGVHWDFAVDTSFNCHCTRCLDAAFAQPASDDRNSPEPS